MSQCAHADKFCREFWKGKTNFVRPVRPDPYSISRYLKYQDNFPCPNFVNRNMVTHFVILAFHNPHFIIRIFSSSYNHPHFSIHHPPSAMAPSAAIQSSETPWIHVVADLTTNAKLPHILHLLVSEYSHQKICGLFSQGQKGHEFRGNL